MSSDDWGNPPPPTEDDGIDMNYGQPLPPQGGAAGPADPGGPVQGSGGPLQTTKPKLDNNDIIAIVINAFLPGVGQMMLGQTTKGIVILAISFFTCGGAGLLWVAVLIDAYLVAMTRKYRQLDDFEIFPDMNKHFGSG